MGTQPPLLMWRALRRGPGPLAVIEEMKMGMPSPLLRG